MVTIQLDARRWTAKPWPSAKKREKGRGRSGVVQYYLLGPMLKIMEEREREQGFPQNEKPSRVLNDIHEH